ncbi:MAG: DNA translocase FtsK [Patescibacteria group bacterium]
MVDKQDKILKILDIIEQRLSIIELTLKIFNTPEMFEDDDVKYKKVVKSLKGLDKVSTAYLQRTFSIGYARSARLMERLEKDGFVGPAEGAKPRNVIKTKL